MAYLCQYCQKTFSRSYNRNRHEEQKHSQKEQEESMMTDENVVSDIFSNNENEEEEMEIDEVENGNKIDSDLMEEVESDYPWEDLRTKVKQTLNLRFLKQKEEFMKKGVSEQTAEARAFNYLLPIMRVRLRRLYLKYLKWSRRMKRDPVHEAIL